MNKHHYQDLAKFLSGLILGDFIAVWWISASGLFPIKMLGVVWTSSVVGPGLIFDASLFILLVHYGWHIGKIPSVKERTYLAISGTIFGIVAILHLLHLFFPGINLVIFGWNVPIWISWIGVLLASFLSYMSFRIRKHLNQ